MEKVVENTGSRLCVISDNDTYKLKAVRRAISETLNGVTRYYGSKWFIETQERNGFRFVPIVFKEVQYVVRSKKDIISMLSKSVQFKQAYAELVAK